MLSPDERLLFLGDSITDAFRRPEEKNEAFQLGNGYVFLLAARLRFERPQDPLHVWNRGVAGDGLRELESRWNSDLQKLEPTLVSLLIGINDTMRSEESPTPCPSCYATRIEAFLEAVDAPKVVLLEPFLLPCGIVQDAWHKDMAARQSATSQAASNLNATFVPLQEAFNQACWVAPPEFWLYDGIHPTAAGFELIARQWWKVVMGGCV